VSAVIKVCALDAPYLEITVPHMLRQAMYPFAEVILVADPRTSFTGKYSRRSRVAESAYRDVLKRLEARGIVDGVVWAAPSPEELKRTLEAYFTDPIEHRGSHDATGAPIYSALLGLELARSDLVLLMDADVFFCSLGKSWVAEGVSTLQRMAGCWLVMTHAGPPAGPIGTSQSLGPKNIHHATWDSAHDVWLFQHATSRYFLTDRRRLRGAVPVVTRPLGLAPLESCLSAGLQRAQAYRANLAIDGSWDLHAEDHREPFPAWAAHIAALVERGMVPEGQRGRYDLNLRRRAERVAWRALIERESPAFERFIGA
jgi:hypothetical protein